MVGKARWYHLSRDITTVTLFSVTLSLFCSLFIHVFICDDIYVIARSLTLVSRATGTSPPRLVRCTRWRAASRDETHLNIWPWFYPSIDSARWRTRNRNNPSWDLRPSGTRWPDGWTFQSRPVCLSARCRNSTPMPFSRECLGRRTANRAGRLPSLFDRAGTFCSCVFCQLPTSGWI